MENVVKSTTNNLGKTSCNGKKLVQSTISYTTLSTCGNLSYPNSELNNQKTGNSDTKPISITNAENIENYTLSGQSEKINVIVDLANTAHQYNELKDNKNTSQDILKTNENVKLTIKFPFANKKKRKAVENDSENNKSFKENTELNQKSVLPPKRLKLGEVKEIHSEINQNEIINLLSSDSEDACDAKKSVHEDNQEKNVDENLSSALSKCSSDVTNENIVPNLFIFSGLGVSKTAEKNAVSANEIICIDNDEKNENLSKTPNLKKRKVKLTEAYIKKLEEKERIRRQEKEAKEQLKRREKEEKERKRVSEIEAKNKEKKNKDDEKKRREEAKEEEKRKKEEEKRKREHEKEEAENKKKKAAEAFSKFFVQQNKVKNSNGNLSINEEKVHTNFMPFVVKSDMKLAPIRRSLDLTAKAELDEFLSCKKLSDELYIYILKSGMYRPKKCPKTLSIYNNSDCVQIIDNELENNSVSIDVMNEPIQKFRAKFFSFYENRRPPYYGTFRKCSQIITPRKPFALDKILIDYEINSDDEWEEEEPGESLTCSEDEKESDDDYEVDNKFFVPHGHLSDEELNNQNEFENENSPETQKAKLKLLQKNFTKEMTNKTEKLKPRLIGIIWQNEFGSKPESCPDILWKSLIRYSMIIPKKIDFSKTNKIYDKVIDSQANKKSQKLTKLNDELIKDLVLLVHNNRHSKDFLIKEFQAYLTNKSNYNDIFVNYTKSSIRNEINKIAEWKVLWDEINNKNKLCWRVLPEFLEKYSFNDTNSMEKWKYTLKPKQ